MSKILIAGSIAYDHLMTFDGEFKDSILTEKDLTHLSVSFLAKTEDLYFGGCSPNISYSLALLGDSPSIIGVAGADFVKYKNWLDGNGVNTNFVDIDEQNVTAAAYILTDKNQGQITIFYPGAINNTNIGFDLDKFDFSGYEYGIVSPELPQRMYYWAQYFKKTKIPYIFDPGQAIPALTKEQLADIAGSCDGMIFNEYEATLIENKIGLNVIDLSKKMRFIIKTLGAKGCELYTDGKIIEIHAIPDMKEVDSTGCGDAFRSGFIHGITNGATMEKACQMGNTSASFVVGMKGTQNHHYALPEFNARLNKNFS
jgi:adenosine kinase